MGAPPSLPGEKRIVALVWPRLIAVIVGEVGIRGTLERLNEAVTDWAVFMLNTQLLDVPLHAPLHPAKELPLAGVAMSVTLSLW
jgi:hypothetical protein